MQIAATGRRLPGSSGIWVGITCEFVEFAVLFCVYFIACAVVEMRAGQRRRSIRWLVGGLLLALGYPLAKLLEFQWNVSQGITGESGIFFTTYYYLTLTHMVHAVWGILGMLWVLARHLAGVYTAEDYSGLEALACYWHATDIIWLVIFPFFYVLV